MIEDCGLKGLCEDCFEDGPLDPERCHRCGRIVHGDCTGIDKGVVYCPICGPGPKRDKGFPYGIPEIFQDGRYRVTWYPTNNTNPPPNYPAPASRIFPTHQAAMVEICKKFPAYVFKAVLEHAAIEYWGIQRKGTPPDPIWTKVGFRVRFRDYVPASGSMDELTVTVNCPTCGMLREDETIFINVEEDIQGQDLLTFYCPGCHTVRKSLRRG